MLVTDKMNITIARSPLDKSKCRLYAHAMKNVLKQSRRAGMVESFTLRPEHV